MEETSEPAPLWPIDLQSSVKELTVHMLSLPTLSSPFGDSLNLLMHPKLTKWNLMLVSFGEIVQGIMVVCSAWEIYAFYDPFNS